MIELNEEIEPNNDIKDEIKESQNNNLANEINYLRKLLKDTDEKIFNENQNNNIINIENLDEILDLKNKSYLKNQNNSKTKDISGKNDVRNVEYATRKKLEQEENANYPTNSNKLYIDSNKKDDFLRLKKEEENLPFNGEYIGLFISENIKNEFNFEILKNGGIDFELRKDSFMSDFSNIENLKNLIDSDQFLE